MLVLKQAGRDYGEEHGLWQIRDQGGASASVAMRGCALWRCFGVPDLRFRPSWRIRLDWLLMSVVWVGQVGAIHDQWTDPRRRFV